MSYTVQITVGKTTFLSLADTPSAFTDQGQKIVRVNDAGDALQFGELILRVINVIGIPAAGTGANEVNAGELVGQYDYSTSEVFLCYVDPTVGAVRRIRLDTLSGYYPRKIVCGGYPVSGSGENEINPREFCVQIDTDSGDAVFLCYNDDEGKGVVRVALTEEII